MDLTYLHLASEKFYNFKIKILSKLQILYIINIVFMQLQTKEIFISSI
jgi:hypothetical protein